MCWSSGGAGGSRTHDLTDYNFEFILQEDATWPLACTTSWLEDSPGTRGHEFMDRSMDTKAHCALALAPGKLPRLALTI